LDRIVATLQHSTAEVSDLVFRLTGVSYRRTHLVFELSNVAVQVAEQCSGIRSSLSLFILSLITGYLFLRSLSRRLILFIAILPITVIKNAFRIVTITLLANFVDMHFLTSHWIHRSGGIPFFAVALAMFIPLVWLLRKTENCMTETVNRINGSILAKN
jgi:exosortase